MRYLWSVVNMKEEKIVMCYICRENEGIEEWGEYKLCEMCSEEIKKQAKGLIIFYAEKMHVKNSKSGSKMMSRENFENKYLEDNGIIDEGDLE